MTDNPYTKVRQSRAFVPSDTRVLVIDESGYSRAVIMEVLRGVGTQNDNVVFQSAKRFLEMESHAPPPDVILVVHGNENPPDFEFIKTLRRMDNANYSEQPVIFLSAMATPSNIVAARDAGADEFVTRPVSPAQLSRKIKKVIEAPQPFISSPDYIGPCRRRKTSSPYAGPERRSKYDTQAPSERSTAATATDLVSAITELQSACDNTSEERPSLVTRVREKALKTMKLARETDDAPLYQTSTAVKYYLDNIESPQMIESHVLETGINALTQLTTLPKSYSQARKSVASLMTVAVRKKLSHYKKRLEETEAGADAVEPEPQRKASNG